MQLRPSKSWDVLMLRFHVGITNGFAALHRQAIRSISDSTKGLIKDTLQQPRLQIHNVIPMSEVF
jgi:hypothetical protein